MSRLSVFSGPSGTLPQGFERLSQVASHVSDSARSIGWPSLAKIVTSFGAVGEPTLWRFTKPFALTNRWCRE